MEERKVTISRAKVSVDYPASFMLIASMNPCPCGYYNGSSDAFGTVTLAMSTTSFTCANVGANTVTLTVTDVNGNSSTCTATVTVQDVTPPTVTVNLIALTNPDFEVDCSASDVCDPSPAVVSLQSGGTVLQKIIMKE